jgi:hypothetical protein
MTARLAIASASPSPPQPPGFKSGCAGGRGAPQGEGPASAGPGPPHPKALSSLVAKLRVPDLGSVLGRESRSANLGPGHSGRCRARCRDPGRAHPAEIAPSLDAPALRARRSRRGAGDEPRCHRPEGPARSGPAGPCRRRCSPSMHKTPTNRYPPECHVVTNSMNTDQIDVRYTVTSGAKRLEITRTIMGCDSLLRLPNGASVPGG